VNNETAKARDCRAFALRLAKPSRFLQNDCRNLGTANDCRPEFDPLDIGSGWGLGGKTGIVTDRHAFVMDTRALREMIAGNDAWV
jgi:hypothetical protein